MDGISYVNELRNSAPIDPRENVFESIMGEYERVVLQSLVTSFGLDFLVQDQHGGDVDTVLNVRKVGTDPDMKYKNVQNEADYKNRGQYDQTAYHQDRRYREINARISEQKKSGTLTDAYTGEKVARNANIDLDHAISAKEIHDDPGRILAGLSGTELANSEENLNPTDRSINRSMKQKDMEEYLKQREEKGPERRARIEELKNKETLTDKEKKELYKLEEIEKMNPDLVRKRNAQARKEYDNKIAKAYYTSPKFAKDTAKAAGKRGVQMAVRQALGFVFIEVWVCARDEIKAIPAGSDFGDMLKAVGNGIKKGFESAKKKYKDIVAKIEEGFTSGVLASLSTTLCNIFFTTAKNIVKCIRQIYASVVQAGKVLLFNPDNLKLGDRVKMATVILGTGASVLAGTAVGELVSKTPIGETPVIGDIVTVFCSSLVSGLLSCSLLIFLDRSKFVNAIIDKLNGAPDIVDTYRKIADAMETLAAKIANIDIKAFKEETSRYADISRQICECESEKEVNSLLLNAYEALKIDIPWQGDFDSFMGGRENRLVFS